MLDNICRLLETTNNIKRSSYVWNAINAIFSAAESVVILLVVTRTNGVYDAGIFSIAFAVANLFLFIGLYGLRRFQASDIHEKYSFPQYHALRLFTCLAMIIATIIYCLFGMLFNSYSKTKAAVIFFVCLLKLVQAYTDVIHGNMQQKDRLDVATKSSTIRYILETLGICIALFITQNLLVSVIFGVFISIVIMFLTTINAGRHYCSSYRPSISAKVAKSLLIDGFPIFISLFLNMYISNAPKYAIDLYLTEEIQAIYNIIFMPAFVVMLVVNFIFNPILTTYANMWHDDTFSSFYKLKKSIRGQLIIVLGLTLLGLLLAYTIGIPVLSWVFNLNLNQYKMELCIVMLGGGALAYGTFFTNVLTLIREQNFLLISYGVAALAAFLMSGTLVKSQGILGATIMYTIIMLILALMMGLYTWKKFKNKEKQLKI